MGPVITVTSPFYFICMFLLYSVFIFIIAGSLYREKRITITLFGSFSIFIYFLEKYFQVSFWWTLFIPAVAVILTLLQKKTQRFKFISSAILPFLLLFLTALISGGGQILLLGDRLDVYYSGLEVYEDYLMVYLSLFPILIISALFFSGLIRLTRRKEKKESKYIFFLWMPISHAVLIACFLIVLSQIPSTVVPTTKWLIVGMAVTMIFDVITYFVIDKIEMVEIQNKAYEEELVKNQLEYQEVLLRNKSEAELRKIRHDMNNILLTVKSLILLGQSEEAVSLLNETTNDLSTVDGIPLCSNSTLNALLSLKKQQCDKEKVDLHIEINEAAALCVDSYDICRLLGNLIDNALEAVLKAGQKTIALSVDTDVSQIEIRSENPFDAKASQPKTPRKARGNGTRIIREIVKKYDGTYVVNADDNTYSSEITLHNTKVD